MSLVAKHSNVWKEGEPYVRDGGVWKPVDTGFVKDSGVWKEAYTDRSPFSFSGSFAAGVEGWVLTGMEHYTDSNRTETGAIRAINRTAANATYTVPADLAGGRRIRVAVLAGGGNATIYNFSVPVKIEYQIGTAGYVVLIDSTVTAPYAIFEGEFDNPTIESVTCRISGLEVLYFPYGTVRTVFDDWEITGAPL